MFVDTEKAHNSSPEGRNVCRSLDPFIKPFTIFKHPVPIGAEAFNLLVATNIMSLTGLSVRLSFS